MNLKHTLLAAGLAVACGALAPAALAADGNITITGKVIAPTCTVSNAVGGIVSVNLPTVLTTAFSGSVGSTTGATPFSLTLTGCPTNPAGVQVAAQLTGANIATDGNLTNTASGGSNVEVQLTNASGTAINLKTTPTPVTATVNSSGNATLSYQAQYYAAVAAVSSGAVQTSVQYTLTYQ